MSQVSTPNQQAKILEAANQANETLNAFILGLGKKQMKKHSPVIVSLIDSLDSITCMVKEGITPDQLHKRHVATVEAKETVKAIGSMLDSLLACEMAFDEAKPHLEHELENRAIAGNHLGLYGRTPSKGGKRCLEDLARGLK